MSIGQFIQHVEPSLFQEYKLETLKDKQTLINAQTKVPVVHKKPVFKSKINLPTIESLPEQHYAKQYIINRKIPENYHSQLYYAENFRTFIDESFPDHGKELKADSRIVIPFYDGNKKLTAIQGRALQADNKVRYITIKADEESVKIYGLDRMNPTKKTYIVEGPFDSMFLPNAIAVAGANLTETCKYINNDVSVMVYDNEPRNKDIIKQMNKVIDMNLSICIWPNISVSFKDINDLSLAGYNMQDIISLIDNNTFRGMKAKFMLNSWKKV
jgi:hypothetical protein